MLGRLSELKLASLFLVLSLAGSAQTNNDDALKLLDEVSKRYADAQSYHIELTIESRTSSEFSTSWRKQNLRAEQAPGNRYRFEGQSFDGSGIVVSDGVTEWNLNRIYDEYTKRPPGSYGHPFPKLLTQGDVTTQNAFFVRSGLSTSGDTARSAHFLPDETISPDGQPRACFVVTFGPDDLRNPFPYARTTHTFWIDKERRVILKSLSVTDGNRMFDPSRTPAHPVPFHSEEAAIYSLVKLDQPIPDADFAFTPPEDARLVEQFASPPGTTSVAKVPVPATNPDMVGKLLPSLTLHATDNTSLQLDSLHGHPVLIDVWATWCVPCLAEMPMIDHIFRATKDKGLVVLGVDRDQDPKAAVDFMKRKNYGWPDYHEDSRASVFRGGIPILMLIGADGKILYYHHGADDELGLRSAVQQLSPAFAAALADF
jgi:thiol-disulfide isomerase/thioredoxin